MYRIEQTLPELRSIEMEENELLKTIKVPKKLFSLIDKLPKPTYNNKQKEIHNNNKSLPEIKNSGKPSGYIIPQKNSKIYINGINVSKQNLNTKKIKMSIVNLSNIEQSETKDESPSKSDDSINEKIQSNYNLEDTETRSISKILNDKISNKKQYNQILPSNKIKEDRITKPHNDHTQDILALIRNKYLRKRRAKNNVEGIQGPINKTDLYEYKGPYASKSYLKQIINRRNPIGKPLGNNIQLIANVYTGNPQLPILPRRLQGIRRPKALLKQGEYSLPSSLQRGANEKYK